MTIDDRCYQPRGLPALMRAHKLHASEAFAQCMRSHARRYSPADEPELYARAQEAEQEAERLRNAYRRS